MAQEAASRCVHALFVGHYSVRLIQVVTDGLEPFSVTALAEVNGRKPFQSVSRRRAEQQQRVEVFVRYQFLLDVLQLLFALYAVNVDTDRFVVILHSVVTSDVENSAGCDVREVPLFQAAYQFRVFQTAHLQGACLECIAGDKLIHIRVAYFFRRLGVADWRIEVADVRGGYFIFHPLKSFRLLPSVQKRGPPFLGKS